MTLLPRRTFLRQSAFAAGSLALLGGTRSAARVVGANNRLRIAVAGLNGRGKAHIAGWLEQPNVEIAYLIDPDQRVLERTLKNVQERVQMLPRIISVAVPRDQHSPRLGHWALWQTVCRRFSSTRRRVAR